MNALKTFSNLRRAILLACTFLLLVALLFTTVQSAMALTYPPSSLCPGDLSQSGAAAPCMTPYFVAKGGDIATGSSFAGDTTSCPGTSPYICNTMGGNCSVRQSMYFGGWNNNGGSGVQPSTIVDQNNFATTSVTGNATVTLSSYSPKNKGDVLILAARSGAGSAAGTIATSPPGVSGGGVTTWTRAYQQVITGNSPGADVEIWYGQVTATGSSNITAHWPGSVGTHIQELDVQEFNGGSGQSWSVDKTGVIPTASSSTTVNYPSLTPSGSNELYFGYAELASNPASPPGNDAGFTYKVTASSVSNIIAYNPNVSSTTAPTAKQATAGVYGSLAVEFISGGASTTTWGPYGLGYYGAAAQDAIFTPDTAQEIATNINSNATLSSSSPEYNYGSNGSSIYYNSTDFPSALQVPYYLGFANAQQDIAIRPGSPPPNYGDQVNSTTYYGGDFGNLPCMPDAFNWATNGTSPTSLSTASSATLSSFTGLNGGFYTYGTYNPATKTCTASTALHIFTGTDGQTMTLTKPANNKPIVIAICGSIYIQSGIKYSYTNLNNIPQLIIIQQGGSTTKRFQIDDDVGEIDGTFIAQSPVLSASTSNSFFDTCATPTLGATTDYSHCNMPQLLIDGALEADYIMPERAWGDLNAAAASWHTDPITGKVTNAANAAELFNYSPEVWIPYASNNPTCGSSNVATCIADYYQSESGLPPVL